MKYYHPKAIPKMQFQDITNTSTPTSHKDGG